MVLGYLVKFGVLWTKGERKAPMLEVRTKCLQHEREHPEALQWKRWRRRLIQVTGSDTGSGAVREPVQGKRESWQGPSQPGKPIASDDSDGIRADFHAASLP